MALCVTVPGPCDPEDLIDGIIFAANYLGSTQLLSDKTPSKNVRMMQAQEAVSRIKVRGLHGLRGGGGWRFLSNKHQPTALRESGLRCSRRVDSCLAKSLSQYITINYI